MPGKVRLGPSSLLFVFVGTSLFLGPGGAGAQPSGSDMEGFFRKKRVTIAVTDSGLGGLSVMAEAARRMKESGVFEKADFLFFNALFSAGSGYNSLKTREEKIRVFSSALESLEARYRPDIILIGCNTLSVLYEETPFAKRTKVPVIGIVDAGVDLIDRGLREHPEASVIIFGTPTTIQEGAHRKELERRGFAARRIHTQFCPELESFIERDYQGDETGMLITGCVGEALQNIEKTGAFLPPLIISLNCTHYGYALPLWENAFEEEGAKPLAILNPNSRMTDPLFNKAYADRFKGTEISVKVVSMVEISPSKIESLGGWLQERSSLVADALRCYEHIPGLFEWEKFLH